MAVTFREAEFFPSSDLKTYKINDINSLFTNIPLTETVQICVEAGKQRLVPNYHTTPDFVSFGDSN